MLDLLSTQNQLHTRLVDFTPQEYIFVLQVILGERPFTLQSFGALNFGKT